MNLDYTNDIILENDAVRLEPLNIKHLEALSPIVLENPDLLKYSPPKFGTIELLEDYINDNLELRNNKQKYPFVIFSKQYQAYTGCSSLLNVSAKDQRIEIGSTWLGKKYQRSGINRNSKYLLMSYIFEELNWKRVEFKTDARNEQFLIAIKAIGAKYEGTLRSHTLMSDGFRRDSVFYSILSNEWPTIKKSIFKNIIK